MGVRYGRCRILAAAVVVAVAEAAVVVRPVIL